MLEKHTLPSLQAGLMIVDKAFSFTQLEKILNFLAILAVISMFSIGLYTGPRVAGMATAGVKEGMGKVTGMAVEEKNG